MVLRCTVIRISAALDAYPDVAVQGVPGPVQVLIQNFVHVLFLKKYIYSRKQWNVKINILLQHEKLTNKMLQINKRAAYNSLLYYMFGNIFQQAQIKEKINVLFYKIREGTE